MVSRSISIQEKTEEAGGWKAVVRFNNGPENPVTISNPFTSKEEEDLEWYFEQHLELPFLDNVRAEDAAASITAYGESLFKQVFTQNSKAHFTYTTALQSGLNDVQIEIEGSPGFHALHWEALKDPEMEKPLALHAKIMRKNLQAQKLELSVHTSPTINLLVVVARPYGKRDIGYRTISRPL